MNQISLAGDPALLAPGTTLDDVRPPRLSIVIPTLNRHDLLLATVRQVFQQRLQDFEVWIIDQSPPALAEAQCALFEREFGNAQLRYVTLDVKGLPNARNEGIARAQGDVVLFIDDDVILLSPDFLSAHLEPYADPTVGGVCGRVIERSILPNARRTMSRVAWTGRTIENLLGHAPCRLDSLKGANMSFRAIVFAKGGFDRRYTGTALLEEADMSFRIARQGWKLLFQPQAELLHLSAPRGGVRAADALAAECSRFRSTAYFVSKNRGRVGLPPFAATFSLIAAARALRWRSPSALSALMKAALDGLHSARQGPLDGIPGRPVRPGPQPDETGTCAMKRHAAAANGTITWAGNVQHPRRFALDEAAVRSFSANGYLSLPSITSLEEVGLIRDILQRLLDNQVGRSEGMLFDFAGPDDEDTPAKLPQLLDPRTFAPELLKTEFFRNAEALARTLLGPKARFLADHALLKPARDGAETPWHQDDAFRSGDVDHDEVSVWMPLQDVDAHNGCLAFIPTSNQWDVLPHRWLAGDKRVHALECFGGFDPDQAVHCPLPAGGCTVHANRTLHWAGPNRSESPRLAYVLVFGLPSKKRSIPRNHHWLLNKDEPRIERRRRWMLQGGYVIHLWRRAWQIPQVGARETTQRLVTKLSPWRRRV